MISASTQEIADLVQAAHMVKRGAGNFIDVLFHLQFLVQQHSEITHYSNWYNDLIIDMQKRQVGISNLGKSS